ncbi:MAG: aspartate--tRNA(Asn) ligase [Patescibacteria group bacterium]
MQRTLNKDTKNHEGEEVRVMGWVYVRRDHGKLIFIDIRDRSGLLQVVFNPQVSLETHALAGELKSEDVVAIIGKINKRPEKLINLKIESGTVELEATKLEIITKSAPLPFDIGKDELDVDLNNQLDHRALTLRHPKVQAVYKIQETVIDAFRQFMKSEDFFEFQAPVIVPATAEGGAEVFPIKYFEYKAYLTQSPQLYKQIVMSAFERVFSVNKVFRAEPSQTTRHLTEIVSLDAEMGFIDSWLDVRDMAEKTVRYILQKVKEERRKEIELLKAVMPTMIEKTPTLSLTEIQNKIFEKTGKDSRGEKDLNPEDERVICEIIKEETGSDFVFVYGYPTKKKPFYVYPNPKNPEFNDGMDLLCRGVEWLSGGRRVNSYEQLLKHVEEWKMNPDSIKLFLDAFKYAVPPEGGFAFGAERITMQLLELANIREASMFPRDMNRIDSLLSTQDE